MLCRPTHTHTAKNVNEVCFKYWVSQIVHIQFLTSFYKYENSHHDGQSRLMCRWNAVLRDVLPPNIIDKVCNSIMQVYSLAQEGSSFFCHYVSYENENALRRK